MSSTSQRRLWLLVPLATLLPIPTHIDAADIVISIQRGNAPATIIEVAAGSRITIAADGTVEVTLPDANAPNRVDGPKAIAPTFALSHPDKEKLERPFQIPPSVAFSPDGKLLASTDSQATIYLWDVQTRKQVRRLHGPEKRANQVRCPVAFSPDGRTLAVGGRHRIDIWDVATGRLIRAFDEFHSSFPSIAFSPDGKTLASCDGDYHMIQLWDISSGMVREQIKAPDQECAVHYSKSGRLLVAWHERNEHLRGFPAQDILAAPEKWDVLDHASPFSIAAAAHVSFMNDSKTVLGLWETDSRQLINRFAVATDNGSVSSVAISPDRKRLAVAYRFGKLHVWWLDDEQSDSRAGVPKSTGPKP